MVAFAYLNWLQSQEQALLDPIMNLLLNIASGFGLQGQLAPTGDIRPSRLFKGESDDHSLPADCGTYPCLAFVSGLSSLLIDIDHGLVSCLTLGILCLVPLVLLLAQI